MIPCSAYTGTSDRGEQPARDLSIEEEEEEEEEEGEEEEGGDVKNALFTR